MRLNFLILASSWALTSAKIGEEKTRSIKDYGLLHTQAFEKLAELHANEIPSSEEDMMKSLTEIVVEFCEGKTECEERCRLKMREEYANRKKGESASLQLPDDFDEDVLDSLISMYSIINTVTTKESIDDVLSSLNDIEKDLEENKKANEKDKSVAIAGLSVAKESAALWHKVYNDHSHPLYGLHHEGYYGDREIDTESEEGDRSLQMGWLWGYMGWGGGGGIGGGSGGAFDVPFLNITYFILEDVVKFIANYQLEITLDPTIIVPLNENFLTAISDSLGPSISASASIVSDADPWDPEDSIVNVPEYYANNSRV